MKYTNCLHFGKHYDEPVLGSYLMSCCMVCMTINVTTSKYIVVSFILGVRGGPRKKDRGEKCTYLKRPLQAVGVCDQHQGCGVGVGVGVGVGRSRFF